MSLVFYPRQDISSFAMGGLRVISWEESGPAATYRDSIIRNVPIVLAYFLFLIPFAGWILCPLVLGMEGLTALGDRAGMRTGDLLARTQVVLDAPVKEEKKPSQDQQPDVAPTGTDGPLNTQQ
jgi:hypothetical protein